MRSRNARWPQAAIAKPGLFQPESGMPVERRTACCDDALTVGGPLYRATRNTIADFSHNQKLACLRRSSRLGYGRRDLAWPYASRLRRGHQTSRAKGAPRHPLAQGHAVFDDLTSATSLTARQRRRTAAALADKVSPRRECGRSADARRRGGARVARCAAPRVRVVALVVRSAAGRPEVRSAGARLRARWRRARRDAKCPGWRRR